MNLPKIVNKIDVNKALATMWCWAPDPLYSSWARRSSFPAIIFFFFFNFGIRKFQIIRKNVVRERNEQMSGDKMNSGILRCLIDKIKKMALGNTFCHSWSIVACKIFFVHLFVFRNFASIAHSIKDRSINRSIYIRHWPNATRSVFWKKKKSAQQLWINNCWWQFLF